MIRHIVLFRARGDLRPGTLDKIYAGLAGLKAAVPGMLDFQGGPDVSPEGMQRGLTQGFCIDFVDEAARDAYLVDPDHQALGAQLVAATENGRDGLYVVDLRL